MEHLKCMSNRDGGFVVISRGKLFDKVYCFEQIFVYDPETFVMYVILAKPGDTTMSVLYNADGTPKLYNPDK